MSKAYWNRVSRRFGVAGIVLGVWGLFYPRPYLLVVPLMAITPAIGVAVSRLSRGVIDPIDESDNKWNLGTFVVLPPLALALVDLRDFRLVNGSGLLGYGAALGVLCGLLYLWARPSSTTGKPKRWWEIPIGWVAAVCYGWALAAMLNGILPQSQPQRFELPVLAERVSTGRYRSYYLKLPPFGPVHDSDEWDVGRSIYKSLTVGDHVCIYLYPGALRDPWYDARLCELSDRTLAH